MAVGGATPSSLTLELQMNKRIAKKHTHWRAAIRLHRLWKKGYGPDDGIWPATKRAQAYLLKCKSAIKLTNNIVNKVNAAPWEDKLKLLIRLWRRDQAY